MNWIGLFGLLFGLAGFLYAGRLYLELRRWAHLIKYGRIVVAYKGKVKLNAPLQEWALWCKLAEKEKGSNGRVLYQLGGTNIAVLRKSFVPDAPLVRVAKKLNAVRKVAVKRQRTGTQVREGTWSAQDETVST